MKLFGRKTKEGKDAKTVAPVKAVSKSAETKPVVVNLSMGSHRILIKPLVSEKATMANALNKYVFVVSRSANKVEIKKAVKEIYGVMPQAVNIINKMGKYTFLRGRLGKTKDFKKAIVTLKKGDSIKIYEGI